MPNQNPLLPSHLGQTQVSSALQNLLILQQSPIPLQQLPVQLPFQHPLPPQAQSLLQGTVPSESGITAQPQTFGSVSNQPQIPPLPTSKSLISQVQPPILQHSRSPGAANLGRHPQPLLPDNLQQSYVPPPLTSQRGSSSYPVMPNGLDSLSKEAGTFAPVSRNSTSASRDSMHSISGVGLAAQTGTASEVSEVINNRSKRPKLEDGGGARLTMTDTFSTISSVPAQSIVSGSVAGSQMQHSEKQTPQLASEVESAFPQQVMSLTSEQLSSLPLEQQLQVLQLQQMPVKQNL